MYCMLAQHPTSIYVSMFESINLFICLGIDLYIDIYIYINVCKPTYLFIPLPLLPSISICDTFHSLHVAVYQY